MNTTAEETIFLDSPAAKVTSARVIVGNQTFAMSGITSVEVKKETPKVNWFWPTIILIVGLATLPTNAAIGIIFAVIGALWLWSEFKKPTLFHLVIRAAGGEVNALTSTDATAVEVIASAITDAMVFRG